MRFLANVRTMIRYRSTRTRWWSSIRPCENRQMALDDLGNQTCIPTRSNSGKSTLAVANGRASE